MEKQYPSRLFHQTPSWVGNGAIFHIRIRCASCNKESLTQPELARPMLESAQFYTQKSRWFVHLFLLMPDHVHALLSFPKEQAMSRVVADWKRYQVKQHNIAWQENFFDHRIRNAAEYLEKAAYIRNNPVAKGFCNTAEEWPHVWSAI
jgi:REP element-mobilizing transposase RayT